MLYKTIIGLCFCFLALPSFSQNDNENKDRTFDYFFLEGLRLKTKGEHNDAFNAFRFALDIDSTSSAALYEVAQYYLDMNQLQPGLDALNKAMKYNPGNTDYKMALANLYREIGRFGEAISLYEELTEEFPDRPELHFYLSEMYIRVNKVDKAIESLNDLENNIGLNEMVSMQKYRYYMFLGQNDKAMAEIQKLADKFPAEARYVIIMGDHYLSLGQFDRALEYYNKAHQLEPDSPYYLISMANYYEQTGNDEMVYREIENAIKNPDLDIDTKLAVLGKYFEHVYKADKDREKIIPLMETLLEQHPQERELNMIYGEFLLSLNRLDDAKFQFSIVTEAEPDNLKAWTQLLSVAVKSGNNDEMIETAGNAQLHFPDRPEFYYYQAMGYYLKEDYPKALDIFQKAVTVIPEEDTKILSEFYGQIGDLYHQLGDKEKTFEAYEQALQYNENNVLVLNNYAYFLAIDKRDLDKAERMSARTVQIEPNNPTYIDTYAWIFFQKANYSLAKFYIESALTKDQGRISSEIIEHYGDILFKTGNADEAVEQWKKALSMKEEGDDAALLEKKIKDRAYYE